MGEGRMDAKHIHLVGIGGIGLSAIARVLLARGYQVSGSDPAPSWMTAELAQRGAQVFTKHRAENIGADIDLVVVTSAVSGENPEVRAAQARGIRVVKRREFLGELTAGYRTLAIGGSHGKTTTTALAALMLEAAGLDPTVIVGGLVPEFASNARVGQGDYFVIEADEYDHAFLGLNPYLCVITNVDYDHPDIFPTPADYQQAFVEFARRVQPDGMLIVCGEDAGANSVAARVETRTRTRRYGWSETNDWRVTELRPNGWGGNDFQIIASGRVLGEVHTRIPGRHNVLNALGASAAALSAGAAFEAVQATLEEYRGTGRRFEVRGEFGGVTVVDDYAHHPSEIRATLAAARERFGDRKLYAVFQPHTYSRTRALLDEFASAFDLADCVIITEIYAARERDPLGVSGMDIVARTKHHDVRFIATLEGAVDYLARRVAPGAVVITLGAGDVYRVGDRLAEIRNVERAGA
jgi:UDP-N-acetylmuramate--alanine ligase